MPTPKCKSCKKPFKKDDDIMVVDGNFNEAVHDECHYNYLANMHLNNLISLKELKEELENE